MKLSSIVMKEIRRLGALGGKAAAKSMTKEERIERSRKAGSAPKRPRKSKGAKR